MDSKHATPSQHSALLSHHAVAWNMAPFSKIQPDLSHEICRAPNVMAYFEGATLKRALDLRGRRSILEVGLDDYKYVEEHPEPSTAAGSGDGNMSRPDYTDVPLDIRRALEHRAAPQMESGATSTHQVQQQLVAGKIDGARRTMTNVHIECFVALIRSASGKDKWAST
eukprot:5016376-Amphidinium_carterae.1